MGFLQPLALAAFPLTAIPLILHLWRRRQPPLVEFPAVRYLAETTRQHSKRLRLQHLLLLVLRTLLVGALVLAASRPVLRAGGGAVGTHGPTAVALVLDNSLSSAAVRDGTPTLEVLRALARDVLRDVTAADQLWVVLADGVPRRHTAADAATLVDSVTSSPVRLDLAAAVAQAAQVVRDAPLPSHEVHVLSDLQRSALGPAEPVKDARIIAVRVAEDAPLNLGLAGATPSRALWGPDGGTVVVEAAGDTDPGPVLVALSLDSQPGPRAAVRAGEAVEVSLAAPRPGWWSGAAELAADELRGDNRRLFAVRVASPAAVTVEPRAGRFVREAVDVLIEGGRLTAGTEVTVGSTVGPRATLLMPPDDPALLGALNRELAGRGIAWRYGAERGAGVVNESALPRLEGTSVTRRAALEAAGAPDGVLARVDGAPWLVIDGAIVLAGSRLDPDWTDLPIRPEFLAVLDDLLNLVARGDLARLEAAPAAPLHVPPRVTALSRDGRRRGVEPGATLPAPAEPGIYFLLAGADTAGVLAVNPDSRESLLEPASRSELLHAFGDGLEVVDAERYAATRLVAVRRAELTGGLLVLAVLLALAEAVLARARRTRA